MQENKRHSFGGTLGFVLAAAGSAVGLGNIWRFPSLAAKDGGGMFLLVYLILTLTFGFTLLASEVAIGRKTRQSPLTAYRNVHKGFGFLGLIACLVPFLILPYYCVIGGWVLKYAVGFITGAGAAMADKSYFTNFISGQWEPLIYLVIFLVITSFIVTRGVNRGIEAMSRLIMPVLIVIVIGIVVFSLTISHDVVNEAGETVTRTGVDGLLIYLIPDFKNVTLGSLVITILDAMGQLFYSISVAMGIMVAYGSYVRNGANLVQSVNHIEIFDTAVAILAGAMIIPAVYVFQGAEGMRAAGPSLMFVSLPDVFLKMGFAGNIIGALFFIMVLFAAVTSSVSILEAVTSSFMDEFKMRRRTAAITESVIALALGVIVCLGYNRLYFEVTLPNGSSGQILDVMDYVSNQILMPVLAAGTCILIGWFVKPKYVVDELTRNGEHFGRKTLYTIMVKYVAPVLLIVLFIQAIGVLKL